MATQDNLNTNPTFAPQKTRGEVYEGIAFTYCKAAMIVLLIHLLQAGRFTLPIVAGAAAVFTCWRTGTARATRAASSRNHC